MKKWILGGALVLVGYGILTLVFNEAPSGDPPAKHPVNRQEAQRARILAAQESAREARHVEQPHGAPKAMVAPLPAGEASPEEIEEKRSQALTESLSGAAEALAHDIQELRKEGGSSIDVALLEAKRAQLEWLSQHQEPGE